MWYLRTYYYPPTAVPTNQPNTTVVHIIVLCTVTREYLFVAWVDIRCSYDQL
jgi:hypothetical protein